MDVRDTKDWEAWEKEVEEPIQWDDLREAQWDELTVRDSVVLAVVGVASVVFMALAIVGGVVMWRSLT